MLSVGIVSHCWALGGLSDFAVPNYCSCMSCSASIIAPGAPYERVRLNERTFEVRKYSPAGACDAWELEPDLAVRRYGQPTRTRQPIDRDELRAPLNNRGVPRRRRAVGTRQRLEGRLVSPAKIAAVYIELVGRRVSLQNPIHAACYKGPAIGPLSTEPPELHQPQRLAGLTLCDREGRAHPPLQR